MSYLKISKAAFLRQVVEHGATFLGASTVGKEHKTVCKFIRNYDTAILRNQDTVVKTYDGFKRIIGDKVSHCTLDKNDTIYALDKDMFCVESINHSDTYGLQQSIILYRSSSRVLDY